MAAFSSQALDRFAVTLVTAALLAGLPLAAIMFIGQSL
jgi:hypothetical protein